ncbi:DNA helicase [Tanacetum coccineum]
MIVAEEPEIRNVADLKSTDSNKTIEVIVYRKWISTHNQTRLPTKFCCMIIDKQGTPIQANMGVEDAEYFDQLLELHTAYRISDFSCDKTSPWERTLENDTSLIFGKYIQLHNIPNDDFPEHYFNFAAYNELARRANVKNAVVTVERPPNRYDMLRGDFLRFCFDVFSDHKWWTWIVIEASQHYRPVIVGWIIVGCNLVVLLAGLKGPGKAHVLIGSKENSGAKEGTISTSKVEQNLESSIKHGKHIYGQLNELEPSSSMIEGSYPSLSNAFDSPNPTSLAICLLTNGAKLTGNEVVSYVNLLNREPSRKILNFRTLVATAGNADDVVNSLTSVYEVNERFINSLYGFFLGKRMAYPVVENYVKSTWSKYVLVRTMMNSQAFSYSCLIPRMGRKQCLKMVKFYDVPLTAFAWLSVIATKLGTPLMLDAYTTTMCTESWGRLSYVRAMINLLIDVELKYTFNTKAPRQAVCGVDIGSNSYLVYKPIQPNNDNKTVSRQPKPKVSGATHVVNTTTTTTTNSFDALGSMGDVEDSRGVGHFNTISDKEVNNLEEHASLIVKKLLTVESGFIPITLMDLQDGNSKSDVEEYDNETA